MTFPKMTDYFKENVYPNLKNVNNVVGISNEIDYETDPRRGGSYTAERGLRIPAPFTMKDGYLQARDPSIESGVYDVETPPLDVDVVLHELGHNVDDVVKQLRNSKLLQLPNKSTYDFKAGHRGSYESELDKYNTVKDFLDKNKKLHPLLMSKTEDTTFSEGSKSKNIMDILASLIKDTNYKKIIRVPNFEDYDFKKGEFGSDIVETPISKYKEVSGEHHIDRPFSLRNFINLSKGTLKDIVKNPDKFKDVRKKIS